MSRGNGACGLSACENQPVQFESLFVDAFGPVVGRMLAALAEPTPGDDILFLTSRGHFEPMISPADLSALAMRVASLDESGELATAPTFPMLRTYPADPAELTDALASLPTVIAGYAPVFPQPSPRGDRLVVNAVDQVLATTERLRVVVLVLPSAFLTAQRWHGAREALAVGGRVSHLVRLPRSIIDRKSIDDLIVLRWEPGEQGATWVMDARGNDRDVVRQLLDAISNPERSDTSVEAFQIELPVAGSWDLAGLHPVRQRLLASLRDRHDTLQIGDAASVFRGRARRVDRDQTTDSQPGITGRSIRRGALVPISELDGVVQAQGSPVELQTGDVVGQEIGDRPKWAVVSDDYAGMLAANTVVIVRLNEAARIPPAYLAAFLNSEIGQIVIPTGGAAARHVLVNQLAALYVPVPSGLSSNGIDAQLADLDRAIEATLSLLADLESTRDGVFTATDSDELASRLRDSAETGRVFLEVVERVQDPAARLRDTLPYPIARAIRAHDIAGDEVQRYEAMLGITEAAAITLGAIGLAWCLQAREQTAAENEWRTKLWRGGVSLGHWIAVASDASSAARAAGDQLAGFAHALRARRGGRGLRSDLEVLVRERNDARHGGAGPRTRAEALQRTTELSLNLGGLLEGVAFLAGLPIWLVERITLREDEGFDVRALRLMGDHPDFEPKLFQSPTALRDGELYVELAPDRRVPLGPVFSWFDCPFCRRPEVYFVDRVQNSTARLKSFDRGHPYDSQEVADRLTSLGLGPE